MQNKPNFEYLREIFDPDRYTPELGKHNAAYAAELAKQSGPPTSLDIKVLREATAAFLKGKGLSYPEGMSAVSYQETHMGGMQCYEFKHSNTEAVPTIVMYFAGGFCLESMEAVQAFMANVAAYLPCNIILPNYPLAPEVKAPEILARIDRFLQALLRRDPPSKEITLMGWSSGGNLALTSYLNLQQNAPELAGHITQLILIGPWIDISMQVSKLGPFQKQQNMDRTSIGPEVITQMARWYLPEGCSGAEPEYCPALRNPDELKTVPPVAVITGDCEGTFGDAAFVTYHLRHSGAKAQLMVLKGQTHNHVCFEELSRDTPFVPELIARIIKQESVVDFKNLEIF